MAMIKWQWHQPELRASDGVTNIDIPLDLDDAITLVATLSAQIPRNHDGHPHHELGLEWWLGDTLDGQSWHHIENGYLSFLIHTEAARISSPIGSRAQLNIVGKVQVRTSLGYLERRDCTTANCPVNHESLVIKGLSINVAVRSLS